MTVLANAHDLRFRAKIRKLMYLYTVNPSVTKYVKVAKMNFNIMKNSTAPALLKQDFVFPNGK